MKSGRPGSAGRTRSRGRGRIVLAMALAVQLAVGLLVVSVERAETPAPADVLADAEQAEPSTNTTPATRTPAGLSPADPPPARAPARKSATEPERAESTAPAADPAPALAPGPADEPAPEPAGEEDVGSLVAPDPGPSSSAQTSTRDTPDAPTRLEAHAPAGDSERIFAHENPAHAAARQRDDDPSSFHWAVIVGVNDYMGRTSDTIGSVGDAHVLRDTLHRNGWRGDQVLTLTDRAATHDAIVRAIEWLMRSTDHRSTVVFSFSGHLRHDAGVTALWPADNRFIWADDLGRMLGAVRADRLWASLQGCHAAGLAAAGLEGPNRLVTYASRVEEKAYEDPAAGQSVMGYHLFAEGLRAGRGDRDAGNNDGRVSVQEAFAWAAPRATARTNGQRYGPQRPVIVDGLGGREFPIAVTGSPARPNTSDTREERRRGWIRIPGLLS